MRLEFEGGPYDGVEVEVAGEGKDGWQDVKMITLIRGGVVQPGAYRRVGSGAEIRWFRYQPGVTTLRPGEEMRAINPPESFWK